MKTQYTRGKVEVMERAGAMPERKRYYKKTWNPEWICAACVKGRHSRCHSKKCQCALCQKGYK